MCIVLIFWHLLLTHNRIVYSSSCIEHAMDILCRIIIIWFCIRCSCWEYTYSCIAEIEFTGPSVPQNKWKKAIRVLVRKIITVFEQWHIFVLGWMSYLWLSGMKWFYFRIIRFMHHQTNSNKFQHCHYSDLTVQLFGFQ